MNLTLDQKWTDKLVTLPEQGMGYQVVNVKIKCGILFRNMIVQNCSVLQFNQSTLPFTNKDIVDITL